jgi:hypothetical protein
VQLTWAQGLFDLTVMPAETNSAATASYMAAPVVGHAAGQVFSLFNGYLDLKSSSHKIQVCIVGSM